MEKQKRFLLGASCVLLGAALGWAALRWVLPFLAPFWVGALLAAALRHPVRALAKATGGGRQWAAGALLFLLAAVVLGLLWLLAARLLVLAQLTVEKLPLLAQRLSAMLTDALSALPDGVQDMLPHPEELPALLLQRVDTDAAGWMETLGRLLSALPGLALPFLFTCLATVFFTLDWDRLTHAAAAWLGQRRTAALLAARQRALALGGRLVRAYFLLFCLTLVQLIAGLLLLGIPGAAGLALLIALVDILPVLGVGTVLLPWAAVCALTGNTARAVGLTVLYAVIWAVRQLCEPRLVGRQLGLPPAVSLLCLYVGLRLFGLPGALGLTAAVSLAVPLLTAKAAAPAGEPDAPDASGA